MERESFSPADKPQSSVLSDSAFDLALSEYNNAGSEEPSASDSTAAAPDAATDDELVMTNVYEELSIETASEQELNQWTVAVDLTGLLPPQADQDHGAAGKAEQLMELAEQTADSGVSFVVQAPHEEDGVAVDNQYDRYLISDGEVQLVAQEESQGMAQDLTDLLQAANELAPSENLGLVIQSHGNGPDGVSMGGGTPGAAQNSDNREMSMDQLRQAIDDGLEGSNHDTLDVLDFDACWMASTAVLDSLNGVADHVVASEELEFESRDLFDSQNLQAVFENLIENPNMSGGELAETFVREAQEGSNGAPVVDPTNGPGPHGGTSTLASFDMSNYEDFATALDTFGANLNEAMESSQNAEAIREIISQTPQFPLDDPERTLDQRDLGTFVEQIDGAVDGGQISDPDGSLDRAAADLTAELDELRTAFFGEDTELNYDDLGGLNIHLPDQDLPTFIDYMVDSATSENKPASADQLLRNLDQLKQLVPEELRSQLAASEAAIQSYGTADSAEERAEQLQNVVQSLTDLNQGIVGDQVRERGLEVVSGNPSVENAQIESAPQWNEFVAGLYAAS